MRTLPVTAEPDEFELDKEARWIFYRVFHSKKTLSYQYELELKQDDSIDEAGNAVPSPVIPKIMDVLNFIRNDFLEVPFIAFYRKEYIQSVYGEYNKKTDLSIDDLWKIYELDEKVI